MQLAKESAAVVVLKNRFFSAKKLLEKNAIQSFKMEFLMRQNLLLSQGQNNFQENLHKKP